MHCIECERFNDVQQPIRHDGHVYDSGLCRCEKYNLVCEYISTNQKNKLECIEDDSKEDFYE